MAKAPEPKQTGKNLNQVELNAQWLEALKRENRGRVLKEHFDFNPKNLSIITEKPTNKDRLKIFDEAEKGEQTEDAVLLT